MALQTNRREAGLRMHLCLAHTYRTANNYENQTCERLYGVSFYHRTEIKPCWEHTLTNGHKKASVMI